MVSNITLLQMVLHGHGAMKQLMVKLLVSQTLQVQTTLLHYNQGSNVQSVSYNAQSSNSNVEAVSAPTYHNYSTSTTSSSVRLSNGNTAGATGSSAAQIMAQRTGVPASTWAAIIARESNGQVNAYNPSGASGLFQTMPGWGPTNTVDQQINAAVKAYKAQGLGAWGF